MLDLHFPSSAPASARQKTRGYRMYVSIGGIDQWVQVGGDDPLMSVSTRPDEGGTAARASRGRVGPPAKPTLSNRNIEICRPRGSAGT